MAWKEHHALVCQLVNCMNKSFGLILAIEFSNGFVTFITSFHLFVSALNIAFLMIFMHQAIFLSIFIVVSYNLQSSVFNNIYNYQKNNLVSYIQFLFKGAKLSENKFKFKMPLNNVTDQNLVNIINYLLVLWYKLPNAVYILLFLISCI